MDGRPGFVTGALAASLRFRLSLWISVAIVLGAAVAGAYSFVAATEDAHREQDTQLQQVGYLISRLDAVPAAPLAREKRGDPDYDARIVVRFLKGASGEAIPRPPRRPYFPASLPDGLQTVVMGRERWRVFVRTNAKGVQVAVAQQTVVRDAAARADAIRTVMPILFLGPLLVLIATLLVQAMFRPLRSLTRQLGERHEHDLGEVARTGLPSEVWPFVTAINQLIGRTVRAMAVQRRFIADAAHELRSPMTAMSLQAERLAASSMPSEARERLDALSAGLGRTRVLLDQLLTLARTQEHQTGGTSRVALRKAIQECLEDLVPLAEQKNIDLGMADDADPRIVPPVDPAADPHIAGRPVDIRILVKNLIDNAIRYTPEGGRVDIRVAQREGCVVLEVDDSGPGIRPEERERVFDPFYRVLGSGQIGSGLGLAITRTIAVQLGAAIELLDMPDQPGLRVRVTFPAA